MPWWWNGIHSGLRNRVERRVGSSPTRGTKKMVSLSNWLARRSVKSVPNGLVGSSPTGTTKK
jgi:hypothetical protein